MRSIPLLQPDHLPSEPVPALAMYSAAWGGVVTDPTAMRVPVDDHLVHRGDGVFETLKVCRGAIYNLASHLDRLATSAACIGIEVPWDEDVLEAVCVAVVEAGGDPEALVRILVSRGPGGFSVDPGECPTPGLYVIAYPSKPSFMQAHPEGARAAIGDIPSKPARFATVKTCNYLPNALQRQQARERGVDFLFGLDPQGQVTEGPTENVCIVTSDRVLLRVPSAHILTGTTMTRVLQLAGGLVDEGQLTEVGVSPLTPDDLRGAAEILVLGTTAEVTAVVAFEGKSVGDGRPGPVQQELARRFWHDMMKHPGYRTMTRLAQE